MAGFDGTFQEYHDYIGPRIRNKVNNITRSARLSRNKICEHCGQERELQSAHVHGYERRVIIEKVLSSYIKFGRVICDLAEVEQKILEAHQPIEEKFFFLCAKCHKMYDEEQIVITPKQSETILENIGKGFDILPENSKNTTIPVLADKQNHQEFKFLHRIKLWAKKPNQVNHKIIRAYLALEKKGPVYLDNLKSCCSDPSSKYYVKDFGGNYPQMKTDKGHPHGKVFYDIDGFVCVYPIVRKEIKKWFGE